jgi:hypothetical protein
MEFYNYYFLKKKRKEKRKHILIHACPNTPAHKKGIQHVHLTPLIWVQKATFRRPRLLLVQRRRRRRRGGVC